MKQGQIYICPVCQAEIVVIKTGSGELASRCCGVDMVLKEKLAQIYYCPVCGAEVTVIREGAGRLEPRCCDVAMVLKS